MKKFHPSYLSKQGGIDIVYMYNTLIGLLKTQ